MSYLPASYAECSDHRETARLKVEEYNRLLDRMQLNILPPPDIDAWRDFDFHRLVVARLRLGTEKTEAAQKWEAVKELFREAGRG